MLDSTGQVSNWMTYLNRIVGGLHNPESVAWNAAIERQVSDRLAVRFEYEQRNTTKDFTVSPITSGSTGILGLSNICCC